MFAGSGPPPSYKESLVPSTCLAPPESRGLPTLESLLTVLDINARVAGETRTSVAVSVAAKEDTASAIRNDRDHVGEKCDREWQGVSSWRWGSGDCSVWLITAMDSNGHDKTQTSPFAQPACLVQG